MSTSKNGTRISSKTSKQVEATRATRDQSTDRTKTKKKEKEETKLIAGKISSVREEKEDKTTTKAKSLSRESVKQKEEKTSKVRPVVKRPPPKVTVKQPQPSSKSSKTERPATPPSSRVSKTQFFPSKKMYSNALKPEVSRSKVRSSRETVPAKEEVIKKTVSRVAKTTSSHKITSPAKREILNKPNNRESKTIKTHSLRDRVRKIEEEHLGEASSDTSSVSERPRTATLRKGSIVNNNIVGPDVPKSQVPKIIKPVEEETAESPLEENYEDDFDSYESDFDEYNSSESTTNNLNLSQLSSGSSSESLTEPQSPRKRVSSAGTDDEKKMDSGNYEMPESKHRHILDNIKEAIEKENANLVVERDISNGSFSDEGFEDGKSLQFINFLEAQKRNRRRKSLVKKRKRGEEILSMIRLDSYSFTLFDSAPVPYDKFIKNFGKSNSVQTSVQTGDDDVSEEVQTLEVNHVNKWTQCPPVFCRIDPETPDFWGIYKCNYLGSGGDVVEKQSSSSTKEKSLEKFLFSAGNLLLTLQQERDLVVEDSRNNSTNVPFSKGCILYETQTLSVLKNRPIKSVCFASGGVHKILTAHGRSDDDTKSVVCLWRIGNARDPEMFFTAFGEVTCCTSGVDSPNLIFGGLDDGSLAVWDSKETTAEHELVRSEDQKEGVMMRSPTFSSEIDIGHFCRVVSLCSMDNAQAAGERSFFDSSKSSEICSMDEGGDIIIWGVIRKEHNQERTTNNQGLAHWGSVILVINTRIPLRNLYPEIEDFKCTDLTVNHLDVNHLYVSTNYGIIIHCLANGGKASIRKFVPENQSQANCLEICPFSSQFFVSGCESGDISFYSRLIERPLMVMSDKEHAIGRSNIDIIQWSRTRPLMFYTKDVTNTIHVWNLQVSDLFPTHSIPFKGQIASMTLSPIGSSKEANEDTYMMIATCDGLVYVHFLNDEHGRQTLEEYEAEKKKFLNYINKYV